MYCEKCGTKFKNPDAEFCPECGSQRGVSEQPNSKSSPQKAGSRAKGSKRPEGTVPEATEPAASDFVDRFKPLIQGMLQRIKTVPKKRVFVIGGIAATAIIAIVAASLIPGLLSPLNASNMPTYDKALSAEQRAAISSSVCAKLTSTLPTEEELAEYQVRIQTLAEVGQANEGRTMLAFYQKTNWMLDSSVTVDFTTQVEGILQDKLNSVITNVEILGINDQNRTVLASVWKANFFSSVKKDCAFTAKEAEAKSALGKYESAVGNAIYIAENAPWYPAGYSALGFGDELAIKWVDKKSDCYDCYQWDAKVIAKNGCPSGVYVELNIETAGGTVVAWTNDSLSALGAGQKANMRFQSYVDGYGTLSASVSDYNCY